MERDAVGRVLVVTDASFLINFLAIDRLDILGALTQFRFHVLNHVEAEIRRDDQQARLGAGLAAGVLQPVEITDPDEILLYDMFRRYLGDGESACLALGARRRWVVAADEKGRFRRELFDRLGEDHLLNTLGALLCALRTGIIDVNEATQLRDQLRVNRFDMDQRPFEQLLDEEG